MPKDILLLNAEAEHRAHPRDFSIPRSEQRRALRIGQLVKLVFRIDPPALDGIEAERMWVEVCEAKAGKYLGRLRSEPTRIADLKMGDSVAFGPEHVASIDTEGGPQIPYDKFVVVNKAILAGDAWPKRAIHRPPPEESFTGWWIFTGRETESEAADYAIFVPCSVYEIIDRFHMLDSILDEPVGTDWIWNEDLLEYQRAEGTRTSA